MLQRNPSENVYTKIVLLNKCMGRAVLPKFCKVFFGLFNCEKVLQILWIKEAVTNYLKNKNKKKLLGNSRECGNHANDKNPNWISCSFHFDIIGAVKCVLDPFNYFRGKLYSSLKCWNVWLTLYEQIYLKKSLKRSVSSREL